MIDIKLGAPRDVDPATDPLGRSRIGADPGLTPAEAWLRGRGVWKLKADNVLTQDEVQITDKDRTILAVARITGITKHDDRQAIEGALLENDPRIGTKTPIPHPSQNSIKYA